MQYFTKKPITLIYGPNSVGKSSLIRSLLYRDYIKKPNFFTGRVENIFTNKTEDRNTSTNQFGDRFDIGTFETVIHGHDISKTINYDIEYSKLLDIGEIIPACGYLFGAISVAVERISVTDIFESIESYFLKTEHEYTAIDMFMGTIIDLSKEVCSLKDIELEDQNNINNFKSFIQYAISQMLIDSIRIKTSVNVDLNMEHELFVNNELLLKCNESHKTHTGQHMIVELYTNNEIFEKVFFKPKSMSIQDHYIFNLDILPDRKSISVELLNLEEDYSTYLREHVELILRRILLPNKVFENVYIGPIRKIPNRNDLHVVENFYKNQRERQIKIDKTYNNCMLLGKFTYFLRENRYFNFIFWIIWFPKNIFCFLRKGINTISNSVLITPRGMKFIKQNTNTNDYMWHSLIENVKVQTKVNEWLQNNGKYNSSYTINIDTPADYANTSFRELNFYDESTKTNVHPQDMGVGISQSLPIIIASSLYEDTNIFVEQPELHLHPKLQMEIADEFIRSVNEQNNEFMIESHSEHFLLRIMRRMRQTAEGILEDESLRLTPDDVCLLYVDNDHELTYLQELRLSAKGRLLDHWPNGFFEDGFRERFM